MDEKGYMPRHIIFKNQNFRQKQRISYRLLVRKKWSRIEQLQPSEWLHWKQDDESNDLKILREKDFQGRILHPKSQNLVSSPSSLRMLLEM